MINFAGILLLFFTNYVIIRLVGEKAYGNYSILNVWVNFFLIFLVFGFDDVFIATVPRLTNNRSAILSLLKRSFIILLGVFLLVVLFVFIISPYNYLPFAVSEFKIYFFLQLVAASVFTLLIAFLRSLNMILRGQLFEKLLRPAVVLILIFFCILFKKELSFENLLLFQIISILFLCIILWKFLKVQLPAKAISENSSQTSIKSNLSFLGISLLYMLSTRLDLIMLSGKLHPQEVGYYNMAARISDLVGYPFIAINLVVHTLLSNEYAGPRRNTIYNLVMRICFFTFLLTSVVLAFIFFFGKEVLRFFGENYTSSFSPLLILSSSHLLYSLALPFNALLMVSNRERFSLLCLAANVIATFTLAYILIPVYASRGAAFSILGGSCIYLLVTCFVIYQMYNHEKVRQAITSK